MLSFGIGLYIAVEILAGGVRESGSVTSTPRSLSSSAATVEHKIYGTVQSLAGNTLVIRTRTGRLVTVDGQLAHSNVLLRRDRPVIVYGTADSAGVIHARAVWRTFPDAAHWPTDR